MRTISIFNHSFMKSEFCTIYKFACILMIFLLGFVVIAESAQEFTVRVYKLPESDILKLKIPAGWIDNVKSTTGLYRLELILQIG